MSAAEHGEFERVLARFDALIEAGAATDQLVREAARLTGCAVSVRASDGTVIRADAEGAVCTSASSAMLPDAADIVIERDGDPRPVDEPVRSRLRHALRVAALVHREGSRGEPGLLEVLLSDAQTREARLRAAQLLGIDLQRPTRVLAVSATDDAAIDAVVRHCPPGRVWRSAPADEVTALVLQDDADSHELATRLHLAIAAAYPHHRLTTLGQRPWVGLGDRMSVSSAPLSWRQARRALRFTSSTLFGWRAVDFGGLGALDALADLPVERLRDNPVVVRLNALADTEVGAIEVATAEAFCTFGSLRRTAGELHVHHSTVAARLEHFQAAMGWDLSDPIERFLATLALMLRRVLLTATALGAVGVDDVGARADAAPVDRR